MGNTPTWTLKNSRLLQWQHTPEGRSWQQWTFRRRISCGQFWRLGFEGCCSADAGSFSLEVSHTSCQCGPVCMWSCSSQTAKQIFFLDWRMGQLTLVNILLTLTVFLNHPRQNLTARLWTDFTLAMSFFFVCWGTEVEGEIKLKRAQMYTNG